MQTLSPLQQILASYRNASKTEREKGNYFEELIRTYLRYEPTYADLYSDVWLLKDVPDEFGISKRDTGIETPQHSFSICSDAKSVINAFITPNV